MAENTTMNTLVKLIIVIFVLVIAIFGIMYLSGAKTIKDLFPDFTKEDKEVRWNGEFFLENPGKIVYYVDIPDSFSLSEDFYYWYDNSTTKIGVEEGPAIGWKWSKNGKDWFNAGNIYRIEFKEISGTDKDFLKRLNGTSPEEGLKLIVRRITDNYEGTYLRDIHLTIKIGEKNLGPYDKDSKIIYDLDAMIDRINKATRIYLRKNAQK